MHKILTDPEEQLLWKSIRDQRGENSLWLTDFAEASAKFQSTLIARGNTHPLTSSQLRGWFERSAARHANPPCRTEDIFRFGPGSCNIRRSAAEASQASSVDPTSIQPPQIRRRGRPRKLSRNQQRKANVNKIGHEGLLSGSPCLPCMNAERDCLVHPDYELCQFCTRRAFPTRGCQAGGTRGYIRRLEQAQSPHRDAQNQKRWKISEFAIFALETDLGQDQRLPGGDSRE
ncbi:MAG: hypothetical protein Q9215_006120 [Flavoplaca cf. flavocitrina]